jgi:tRNA(fMet)-specific endonuclease VapC
MILDTSVLVDIDRGSDIEKIERLDSGTSHKISAVTVSEFFTGVHMREEPDEAKARRIISRARVVPLEGDIARKAGRLIARKKKQGLGLNINDIYIAATALEKEEAILTRDTEDFEQIEELDVKDWEEY